VATIAAEPGLYKPSRIDPALFDLADLPARERMLIERVLVHYFPYFQRHPDFATDTITRLTGLNSPDVTPDTIARLIRFAFRVRTH
jgi:hypothetical protein